jgi:hypothetical protein
LPVKTQRLCSKPRTDVVRELSLWVVILALGEWEKGDGRHCLGDKLWGRVRMVRVRWLHHWGGKSHRKEEPREGWEKERCP